MHSDNFITEAIGMMSGTSLDGLDIAWCRFEHNGQAWSFKILASETLVYPSPWAKRLREAYHLNGENLMKLHTDYGRFLGSAATQFIKKYAIQSNPIIASHGHTVFHQPSNGFTFQIGCGAAIASQTRSTVVCDFRSLDVALGGQGAPLVPIGDQLLFENFHYCLNLGGFANISMQKGKKRIAFDICPANIVLNKIVSQAKISKPAHDQLQHARQPFLEFDPEGSIAATGKVNEAMLHDLNNLEFYRIKGPRSLGQEWVYLQMMPIINSYPKVLPDVLRTLCQHIAQQTASVLTDHPAHAHMLATGGGVLNTFLMQQIQQEATAMGVKTVIPDSQIIHFKEALIFAFLGVLRLHNRTNTLASVTGASNDSVGGAIYDGSIGKFF